MVQLFIDFEYQIKEFIYEIHRITNISNYHIIYSTAVCYRKYEYFQLSLRLSSMQSKSTTNNYKDSQFNYDLLLSFINKPQPKLIC